MMRRYIIPMILLMASATSCLFDNDMAYPVVDDDILEFVVEGQKSVTIDKDNRTVHVELLETADIRRVKVDTIVVSDNASIVGGIPEYLDMTDTVSLNVKVYEDNIWKVSATQPVERYISVSNQIGDAEFDLENKSAIVYVSDVQSLSALLFHDVKLAPEGAVIRSTTGYDDAGNMRTEECRFPMTLDCVHQRTFLVSYNGPILEERGLSEWNLKVLKKKLAQQVTEIYPWCYHAKVYGTFSGAGEPVMEYRKASEQEWTTVADAVVAGVGISADITGLEAGTEYFVRVGLDGEFSGERSFVTDTPEELYNMSFDKWYQSGKIWYPYAQGADPTVWDSANPGAATFIGSSTTPEDAFVVKGRAAKLESKFAVIAFAAGNIYTGKFGSINGIGAILDWGVPFTGRPAALKGYYSYSPKPIDNVKPPHADKTGQMDRCQITVFLTDWSAPFKVNTTTGDFVDTADDPSIIAFARLETDENSAGQYREFTLPLEYRDKTRRPTYVVIACAASYLGDYFTGGVGSTLYIDEFEFVYE